MYVGLLVKTAIERQIAATVWTNPSVLSSTEWEVQMTMPENHYQVVLNGGLLEAARRSSLTGSLLIVPDADRLLRQILLARLWYRTSINALIMRPPANGQTRRLLGAIKAFGMLFAMYIGVHVSVLQSPLSPTHPMATNRIARLRTVTTTYDPVKYREHIPQETARRRLNLPLECRIWSILGAIDPRKGTDLAVAAVSQLGADDVLLIAGKIEHSSEAEISSTAAVRLKQEGRLIVRRGYLSDEELVLHTYASTALLLPYSTSMGSGILLLGAASGVPMMSAGETLVAEAISQYGLGRVAPFNAESFADILRLEAANPTTPPMLPLPSDSTFFDSLVGIS